MATQKFINLTIPNTEVATKAILTAAKLWSLHTKIPDIAVDPEFTVIAVDVGEDKSDTNRFYFCGLADGLCAAEIE